MNETRVGYCDICEKTIKIKSNSKHIISKTHKHKINEGTVVEYIVLLIETLILIETSIILNSI